MDSEITFDTVMESSPKVDTPRKYNFKLELLDVGKSLQIPIDLIKDTVLRTTVSRKAKKIGIKVRVVVHKELGVYEVARVA